MTRVFLSRVVISLAVVLAGSFASHAQTSNQSPTPTPTPEKQEPNDRVYSAREVDVKAKLIRPLDSPGPGNDCRRRMNLRVILRAVLRKSGSVTEAAVVRTSSCASFDEDAIRVVNKTKFTPAMKDGQPVSQSMQFEFSFQRF